MPGQTIQGAYYVWIGPPVPGIDPAPQVYASLGSGVIQVQTQTQGAANIATTQLTTSTSAQQIFAARATRRSAIVTNADPSINMYVGNASVTTANGELVAPGLSLTIPTTAAIYVIAASGTPLATGMEAYD